MRRIISFDMDGTLVKEEFADKFWYERVPELVAQKRGIGFEKALSLARASYRQVSREEVEWYLPSYWFDRFKLDVDPQRILEGMKGEVELYSDVLEILESLYGKYELIVVSNASEFFLHVELEGVKHFFRSIYSCVSDLGEVKKDKKVYEKVCNDVGVSPQYVLHMGDDPTFDYDIPRSLGIEAYLIDRCSKGFQGREAIKDLRDIMGKFNDC